MIYVKVLKNEYGMIEDAVIVIVTEKGDEVVVKNYKTLVKEILHSTKYSKYLTFVKQEHREIALLFALIELAERYLPIWNKLNPSLTLYHLYCVFLDLLSMNQFRDFKEIEDFRKLYELYEFKNKFDVVVGKILEVIKMIKGSWYIKKAVQEEVTKKMDEVTMIIHNNKRKKKRKQQS